MSEWSAFQRYLHGKCLIRRELGKGNDLMSGCDCVARHGLVVVVFRIESNFL